MQYTRDNMNIPTEGRPSRILAKNLLRRGDRFLMTGGVSGVVISKIHWKAKKKISFTVVTPSGKTFGKCIPEDSRVWILETPENRFQRRNQSRSRSSK